MYEVRQTRLFAKWLDSLTDLAAAERIAQRIARAQSGLLGDVSAVGEGVSEMRIHHGPGYRLYFTMRSGVLVILLCGGSKRTQDKDIRKAKELARELET